MSSDKHTKDTMKDILANLNQIVSAVTYAVEAGSLEDVLQRIAEVSRQLVKARYAALGIPDGEGGLLYFKVSGLTPQQLEALDGHEPEGRGLLGAIMRERRTIRLDDMSKDSRSVGFCGSHPHMISFLGVPIQVGSQLFGMLYLSDRLDGKPFDDKDQWLIEMVAGYAALAIASVQLSEQQQRIALLEERERIAMELHDGIIQSLYAIGMHIELARTAEKVRPADLTAAIVELNNVIDDIRDYVLNLRISSYQQSTVYDCLQDLASRLHIPETITLEIDAPQRQPPFSAVTLEALCQITNEALSNAVRHSGAATIKIRAWQDERLFHICIADDGRGFDLDEIIHNHTGLGLRNIQQRARLHNGIIKIDTAPGKGTTLTISIPLKE
ncbi:MAG: hypothetical protein Kow00124_19940 [Anaerolineae bacterium]